MAARAGRNISVKVSGAAVAFAGEATTATGNISYQITNALKRVWDPTVTIVVLNGGVAVDPVADPYTVNRLSGTIRFTTATVRTITVGGSYLPLSTLAQGHDLSLDCVATNVDDTVFGATDITRQQVARDCSGTIGRFRSADTYLYDAYAAGVPVVVEFSPDGGTTPHFRAWALFNKEAFQGARKTMLEESVSFEGSADADGRSHTWLV
jgi:hypothetical protein